MTAQPRPAIASPATSQELEQAVTLAHEWGHLKRLPRTGWLHAGIKNPESVAEHSHRTAILVWMIAGLEGADPERVGAVSWRSGDAGRSGGVVAGVRQAGHAERPITWEPSVDRSEGESMDETLRRLTQFSHCAG